MEDKIDPGASTPIYQQIKNLILTRIASGELRPNDQLPSEREYEALLGVSRQTVRRALDELVLQGTLYRQAGKGTYVAAQPSDDDYVGIIGSAAMLAISPDHAFYCQRLEQIEAPEFARALLGLGEKEHVIFFEQLTCVRAEPRYIHRSYFPQTVASMEEIERMKHLSVMEILLSLPAPLPLLSRDHIKPELSDAHDARLLGIDPGSPVQVQRGCMLSANGVPIEAHELVVRGDRFKMDIEFSINQQVLDRFKAIRQHT
jgi:GntR family transcriptional regulator